MSCIVSRAFILFTDAKEKGSHVNFCNTVVKSPKRKKKLSCCFLLKAVVIRRNIKYFFNSLFSLYMYACTSDNLVHIQFN